MVTPTGTTSPQVYWNEDDLSKDELKQLDAIRPYMSESEKYEDVTENLKIRFRKPKLSRQVGTAYYDYTAKENDELSLKRGSVVEVMPIKCPEDGWMIARVDNRMGLVPENFVVHIGDQPTVVDYAQIQTTRYCVGTGGFADVYRGYYEKEPVALKIPRHMLDMKTKVREALEREALILCRLKNKNIIGFIGISLEPMLLVMELCEGGSLFSLCRRMKIAHMPTSIKWAKQVASAMHHLHSQDDPLVHADLKAENVLIKERPCDCGVVGSSWRLFLHQYNLNGICQNCGGYRLDYLTMKVTDFGLSRSLKARRASLLLSGSVSWLAPEVIKRKIYSIHSDIWSYGVFMWEIFSCKIPFFNYDHNVITFAIACGKKTLPLPEGCSDSLRSVFQACWEQEPLKRARFPRIIQMLDVLEKNDDFSFGWNFDDYDVCSQKLQSQQSPFEETLSYAEIHRQFKEGKLADFLWNTKKQIGSALRHLETQAPVVKPRKYGKQRSRFGKVDIGRPSDFRHNVSVRPSGEDTTNKSAFVIKYEDIDEDNESTSDGTAKPIAVSKCNAATGVARSAPKNCNINTNSGYTHLPPLDSSSAGGNENFTFFDFSKKPTAGIYEKIRNYSRLQAGRVHVRRPSPDYRDIGGGRRTDDASLATLADVYATRMKSKSNPDLASLEYNILSNSFGSYTDDSDFDEALRAAAFHIKEASSSSAPNRLNRKANYVMIENRNERCQSFEDNLEEANVYDLVNNKSDEMANGTAKLHDYKYKIQFSDCDKLQSSDYNESPSSSDHDKPKLLFSGYEKPQYSGYDNVVIDAPPKSNNEQDLNSTNKTCSLGRANAFRRKVIGSSSNIVPQLKNSTTSSKLVQLPSRPTETTIDASETQKKQKTQSTEFIDGNEPKESSTSLSANLPVIQMDLFVTNSEPNQSSDSAKTKDNQNYPPPWLAQNSSLEISPSDEPPLDVAEASRSQSLLLTPRHQTSTGGLSVNLRTKSPSPIVVRRRKNSQSVFYVDDPIETGTSDADSPSSSTRQRSGNHKLGNIFSKVTNMFGGRSTSGASESDFSDALAVNESTDSKLTPPAPLSSNIGERRTTALEQEIPSSESPTVRHQHVNLPSANQRTFMKLQDYPDRQRRRPRKESEEGSSTASAHSTTSAHRPIYGRATPSSPGGEPRSFPPAADVLPAGRPSSNTVNTASPVTPLAAQSRISFNTVIELQSPSKAQTSAQFRPQSHVSGNNPHRQHNDILSRPIQSVNDLRQQTIARSSISVPASSMGLTTDFCFTAASSLANLFLDVEASNPATIHQRSKSTDGSSLVSTISTSGLSRTDQSLNSSSKGFHSLQRPKIKQQLEDTKMASFATPNSAGFNRSYISMNVELKDTTVQMLGEINANELRRVSPDGNLLAMSNLSLSNEAEAPPIPRKKMSTAFSKSSTSTSLADFEIPTNLKVPTSMAPVLRMPFNEPHPSYYHQVRQIGTEDGRKLPRPTTLNLEGRRTSNLSSHSSNCATEDSAQVRYQFVKEFSAVPPKVVVPAPPSVPVSIPPRSIQPICFGPQPLISRVIGQSFYPTDSDDIEFMFEDNGASIASSGNMSTSSSGIATDVSDPPSAIPRDHIHITRYLVSDSRIKQKKAKQSARQNEQNLSTTKFLTKQQQTHYGHDAAVQSEVGGHVPKIPLKLNTNAPRK